MADINERPEDVHLQGWKRMYSDGTVTNWRQQSTDFFVANAGIKDFTPASKYFDPSLSLEDSDVDTSTLRVSVPDTTCAAPSIFLDSGP
ncbi:hypothetical protein [Bradyrhizobium sp. 153]|uniref:hypothetical protein n=1 Tax=Bradyrhizobium sp. 153 TaxID=2782627 RepID=UPI001FF9394E|nr:hypothetical protein [Bradyrhizobium sp. 153]